MAMAAMNVASIGRLRSGAQLRPATLRPSSGTRRYRQPCRRRSAKATKRAASHGHVGGGDRDIAVREVDGPGRPERQREAKCQ